MQRSWGRIEGEETPPPHSSGCVVSVSVKMLLSRHQGFCRKDGPNDKGQICYIFAMVSDEVLVRQTSKQKLESFTKKNYT